MPRSNETRHIDCDGTCKRRCRLDASVFKDKPRWNYEKSRCECKKLIDKGKCDTGFIWNSSMWDTIHGYPSL